MMYMAAQQAARKAAAKGVRNSGGKKIATPSVPLPPPPPPMPPFGMMNFPMRPGVSKRSKAAAAPAVEQKKNGTKNVGVIRSQMQQMHMMMTMHAMQMAAMSRAKSNRDVKMPPPPPVPPVPMFNAAEVSRPAVKPPKATGGNTDELFPMPLPSPSRTPSSLGSPSAGLFFNAFSSEQELGGLLVSPGVKSSSAKKLEPFPEWDSLVSGFENFNASSPRPMDMAGTESASDVFDLKAAPTMQELKAKRQGKRKGMGKTRPKLEAMPAASLDAFTADNGEISPWTAAAGWAPMSGETPKF